MRARFIKHYLFEEQSEDGLTNLIDLVHDSHEVTNSSDQLKIGKGSVDILEGKTEEEVVQLINTVFEHEPETRDWLLQNRRFIMKGHGEILFLKNQLLIIHFLKYTSLCNKFGISKELWKTYHDPFKKVCGLIDFRNDITDKFYIHPDGSLGGTTRDIEPLINERDQ
jgi:hypothetical protein